MNTHKFNIAEIEGLKSDGMTWKEIAAYYGTSKESVRGWYRRNRNRYDEYSDGTTSFTKNEDGSATAVYKGAAVYTLEELLEACKVDTDVWEVDRYTVNQWQQKTRDGVLTPLYQVKAYLRRKKPIAPVVGFVRGLQIAREKRAKSKKGDGVVVVLTDMHIGFAKNVQSGKMRTMHDRRALDIAVSVIERINPDAVYILGDMLDFAEFSTHYVTSPDYYWTTQSALVEARYWLERIRAASKSAKIVVIEGNHEKRMIDSIIANMKAAYGLRPVDRMQEPAFSVPSLLDMQSLDIEYIGKYPDGIAWYKNVAFIHGDIVRKSGGTCSAMLNKRQHTTVFGHIHRIEMASATVSTIDGRKSYSAFCPGCLCRVDGIVPGSNAISQWQQGIGVIYVGKDRPSIVSIPIDNGAASLFGETIKAPRDYEALDRRIYKAVSA